MDVLRGVNLETVGQVGRDDTIGVGACVKFGEAILGLQGQTRSQPSEYSKPEPKNQPL
jgi:hypothetical protein